MVIVGELDRLEMWNPDQWSRVMSEADVSMEDVAQNFKL
jgi:DNA-binding transcriptional regulator/RsmH inhibitor MraZ